MSGQIRENESVRSPRRIYQIKIILDGINPLIWRRLQVSENTRLNKLHRIFQVAMGWEDYHLHSFKVGEDATYGPYEPLFGVTYMSDEKRVTLRDIAPEVGSMICYEYDLGDGWEHVVIVENIAESTEGNTVPVCLAGSRACPPEDCGGPYGYDHLAEAVSDPTHPEHRRLVDWVGRPFDPEEFDVNKVNNALRHLG